jgi:hypothetical protein
MAGGVRYRRTGRACGGFLGHYLACVRLAQCQARWFACFVARHEPCKSIAWQMLRTTGWEPSKTRGFALRPTLHRTGGSVCASNANQIRLCVLFHLYPI